MTDVPDWSDLGFLQPGPLPSPPGHPENPNLDDYTACEGINE